MSHPAPDEPLPAAFEELDARPGAPARRWQRPELLLGLLLVVAIAGWGAWDWWQGSQRVTSYGAAQRAAAARDWEEARARFIEAGDYADSPDRAAEASRNIADRDRHYDQALDATARRAWIEALHALRVVQKIQPGYRDSDRLAAEAEPHVYGAALPGAVVLRPYADPPGLYYRAPAGWLWLRDSDFASRLLNRRSRGYFVYDAPATPAHSVRPAPGAGTDPAALPEPVQGTRRLVVAKEDAGNLSFVDVSIDPVGFSSFVWGEHGGWAFTSANQRDCAREPAALRYTGGFECLTILYLDPPSDRAAPVRRPGDTRVFMDVDPDGGRLLLADVREAGGDSPISELYIADAAGRNPRLLYRHPGWVHQAIFGPDRRQVLLTMAFPAGDMGDHELVALLDAEGIEPPRTLLETGRDRGGPFVKLSAAFVAGPRAGEMLLAERNGLQIALSLFRGARADPAMIWAGEGPGSPLWIMPAGDGRLLLGWHSAIGHNSRSLLYLQPGDLADEIIPPLDRHEHLLGAWIKQGLLVYLSRQESDGQRSYALRSLPLSAMGDPNARATLLYAATHSADSNPAHNLLLGPDLLVYLHGDELHARTYDGMLDVLLERGAGPIYTSHFYEGATSIP